MFSSRKVQNFFIDNMWFTIEQTSRLTPWKSLTIWSLCSHKPKKVPKKSNRSFCQLSVVSSCPLYGWQASEVSPQNVCRLCICTRKFLEARTETRPCSYIISQSPPLPLLIGPFLTGEGKKEAGAGITCGFWSGESSWRAWQSYSTQFPVQHPVPSSHSCSCWSWALSIKSMNNIWSAEKRFLFLICVTLAAFLPSVACCSAGGYCSKKCCPPWWTKAREGCCMRRDLQRDQTTSRCDEYVLKRKPICHWFIWALSLLSFTIFFIVLEDCLLFWQS